MAQEDEEEDPYMAQEDEEEDPYMAQEDEEEDPYMAQEDEEDNEISNKNIPETIPELLPKGGFGRLSGRTRNTNYSMRKAGFAVFKSDHEAISKNPEPPSLDSAVLDTEDVSLWIDEDLIAKTAFGEEVNTDNGLKSVKKSPESISFEGALREAQQNKKVSVSENSYELNINRLRQLDEREIKVIQLSSKREVSPSDNEMLQILGGIKRTRLSQICNGLNKEGILSVRKTGRSRMFYLSNSAKAQLLAWGIL
jgi:hypothetical protein